MNDPGPIFQISSAIKFGDVPIGDTGDFYRRLNDRISALCRSLPRSAQTAALTFLMEYVHINVGEKLDFFKYYYRPAWSVLYWLTAQRHDRRIVSDEEIDAMLDGQAIAMLLHSLDDHLVDGEVPMSHVTLLLRGQAWHRMNEGFNRFCSGITGGIEIARELIGDYYSGITDKEAPASLDAYCGLFRKQMATWVIMPVLAAMKTGGNAKYVSGLRGAYESFGIAWRLLDDIQDLEADMEKGERSAVYACLNDDGRRLWDLLAEKNGDAAAVTSEKICAIIQQECIVERIADRIVVELERAAELSTGVGLVGLAEEFRVLARPVIELLEK
ncbi:MAG TPA: class 1 isoprenoid biosynthesis enzyme [Spirochaetota bacterium]|nr:class 1 isoprenoid biosynthesis enzyme [Spirochaetota bacterium]HOD16538.1 class 1 isoprenoid biosynthesis enzyme [Spirochaetota bacterium]HPG52033.1 class 1 isoprenoid biosynthesis enzyme [Spirochaetota bacterium]HPN13032.1 class 1 isoprenoid biosynthesis enzyme [Spirochaetota bacterium]